MREIINANDLNWSEGIVEKLSGSHMFDLSSVVASSIVLVVARFTAFSGTALPELWYVISSLVVSQLLSAIFLLASRILFLKISQPQIRCDFAVAAAIFSNVVWAVAMDLALAYWEVTQFEYTPWQILSGLIFSSLTFIGFSFAFGLVYENLELEKSAKEDIRNLQISKLKLINRISESRTFLLRELALEVQATREILASTEVSSLDSKSEVAELKNTLTQIEIASQDIRKAYPHVNQLPQPAPQIVHNLRYVVTSRHHRHGLISLALGLASVFGVSNWFKYSLETTGALLRVVSLCALGFIIFWAFEKLLLPGSFRLADWFRVLIFEICVALYLFAWILTIGFVAGDRFFGYALAIASALIPFLLLNATAFGCGLIISSQKFRADLADLTESLTKELEKLVKIDDSESQASKHIFSRNLADSPTTASMMLRELTSLRDQNEYLKVIKNVTEIWKRTLSQLESPLHRPEMQLSK